MPCDKEIEARWCIITEKYKHPLIGTTHTSEADALLGESNKPRHQR